MLASIYSPITPAAALLLVVVPRTPELGSPVQLVRVPEVGVPRGGVARGGVVENTELEVPGSSVRSIARFTLEGVARKVATDAARADPAVEIGSPVQFVSVPEVGVPRRGVTRVGLVENT